MVVKQKPSELKRRGKFLGDHFLNIDHGSGRATSWNAIFIFLTFWFTWSISTVTESILSPWPKKSIFPVSYFVTDRKLQKQNHRTALKLSEKQQRRERKNCLLVEMIYKLTASLELRLEKDKLVNHHSSLLAVMYSAAIHRRKIFTLQVLNWVTVRS